MSFSINGPFNRATHHPGICRSCLCSEFLAVDPTTYTSYIGHEKCLACPHKAGQHVWNVIDSQVRRGDPETVFPDTDLSPVKPRHQSGIVPEEKPENHASTSASVQEDPVETSITDLRSDVDQLLAPSPEPGPPLLPDSLPPPSPPPPQSLNLQDSPFHFGDGDASSLMPAPPLPIIEPITLENFYDYFIARTDYSDELQRRILARGSQKHLALLDTIYRDLVAHRVEMKAFTETVAQNYWNEHSDRRSSRALFLEDPDRPEADRASRFPCMLF